MAAAARESVAIAAEEGGVQGVVSDASMTVGKATLAVTSTDTQLVTGRIRADVATTVKRPLVCLRWVGNEQSMQMRTA